MRKALMLFGAGLMLVGMIIVAQLLKEDAAKGSLAGGIGAFAAGGFLLWLAKRGEAEGSSDVPVFSLAVIAGEPIEASSLRAQIEQRVVQEISAKPHFPLAPNAKITTIHVPKLPDETRAALEGFAWGLQNQFDRRGGAWRADFHEVLGHDFVVVYME